MDSDSETQPSDDLPQLEAEYNNPPPLAPDDSRSKWNVQVIDNDGNIESRMVSWKDTWKLENTRVIVHFAEELNHPIGDSGGLLATWLGKLSDDVLLLPVNYKDWRSVDPHIKEKAWDLILSKFEFDDQALRKKYVMATLGSRCRNVKRRLWNNHKRGSSRATRENRPDNVPEDHWNDLVHMRFSPKWKKLQEQNTASQTHNVMPYAGGRMSIPRKREEIRKKTGKTPCRGEIFIETRKKANGSFISEEAKTRAEKLTVLLSKNPQATSNVTTSLDDEYAQVFGPERAGRVRCVGPGVAPSKLRRRATASISNGENSEVVHLRSEVTNLNQRLTSMSTVMRQFLGSSTGEQARTWATAFASVLDPSSEVFGNMFNTTPAFANQAPANQAFANQAFANPAFANPAFANQAPANQAFANQAFANPAFANPAFANQALINPASANPASANPAFANMLSIPPAFPNILNYSTNSQEMDNLNTGNPRG